MKQLLITALLLCAPFAKAEENKNGWSTEAGAGLVFTAGNTETTTASLKDETTWRLDKNIAKFNGNFLTSSNRGVEQAYQWGLGIRYERDLNDQFSAFLGQLVQSDKYQNLAQRYATDIGGKYTIQKGEQIGWFVEAGYRFTRENYFTAGNTGVNFKNINFLRFYNEIEKSWTKAYSVKWWIEYLPNLTNWKAYQFNSELSLSTVLTDVFSLKSAYLLRYYNEPPTGVSQKADTTFTTSLVAKF